MSPQEKPEPVGVGWRHALLVPDPGPPPRRPSPDDHEHLSEDWLAEQRQDESETNRPLWLIVFALPCLTVLFVLLSVVRLLPALFALVGALGCLTVAVPIVLGLIQGRRVTRVRIAEEEERLQGSESEARRLLQERQDDHAQEYARWEAHRRAFQAQPHWYPLSVPADVRCVDVVGGSEVGWSALTSTLGGARLRAGGDLTVVDLSGRAVAADLLAVAASCGVSSRRWILPADVCHLDLGTNLGSDVFADILAAVVAARDSSQEHTAVAALLRQVLDVLEPDAGVATVNAALRGVAGLSVEEQAVAATQSAQLRAHLGSEPELRRRAWEMEQQLQPLEGLALRAPQTPGYAQVKVIGMDRTTGEAARRTYGTYAVAALRHLLQALGQRRAGSRPWEHTILVCGAELVSQHEREALAAAARDSNAFGAVFLYRYAAPQTAPVSTGRGALPVVMRPEDDSTAQFAAQLLGVGAPGARLDVHPLTEVIGQALSDAVADSYLDHHAPGVNAASRGASRRRVPPLELMRALAGVSSWGRSTRQAQDIDAATTTADTRPVRSVSPDSAGLRQLPPTGAVVGTVEAPILTDVNPGILTLATATLSTWEEAETEVKRAVPDPARLPDIDANLGPPEQRLDWRVRGS